MARVRSNRQFRGTIYNETYLRTDGKDLVKKRTTLNKERMETDPDFIRQREQWSQFRDAAHGGKYIRGAFRPVTLRIATGKVSARLLKMLLDVQLFDTAHLLGEKTVTDGLAASAGKALLEGFNFNPLAPLGSIIIHPVSVDMVTYTVDINNIVPANELYYPPTATHFSVQAGFANIDFDTGIIDFRATGVVNNPIDLSSVSISLTPVTAPSGSGYDFAVLAITFYKEVTGVQYSLNDHKYESAAIVGVA